MVRWLVAAFSGRVLRAEDVVPDGLLGRPAERAATPEEEARRDDLSAREFVAAFRAVYGGEG